MPGRARATEWLYLTVCHTVSQADGEVVASGSPELLGIYNWAPVGRSTCVLEHTAALHTIIHLLSPPDFPVPVWLRKLASEQGESTANFPLDSAFPRRTRSKVTSSVDALLDTGWTDFYEASRRGAPPRRRPCDPMSLSTFDQGLEKSSPWWVSGSHRGPSAHRAVPKAH